MNDLEDDFWLVWSDRSIPVGLEPRYRHTGERSAETEAERLASIHGGRFYVCHVVSYVEAIKARHVPLRQPPPF
jgi:hypothetical protein